MDYIKPKRNKTIKGGDNLKINDEKILAALISCGSVRKAAERSGVSVYAITKRLNSDDFKAHTKDINTDTISITLGERHTCQIIDKISGTQWRFKAVLHRKGQEVPNELKTAGNENITITGAGRYIIVDDMTGGKRYKVKL